MLEEYPAIIRLVVVYIVWCSIAEWWRVCVRVYNGRGWDLLAPGMGLIICQDHYYTSGVFRGHGNDYCPCGWVYSVPNLTKPQKLYPYMCSLT